MSDISTTFFAEVQRRLDDIGKPVALTAHERDIVDDYENQKFSAEACAAQIVRERA